MHVTRSIFALKQRKHIVEVKDYHNFELGQSFFSLSVVISAAASPRDDDATLDLDNGTCQCHQVTARDRESNNHATDEQTSARLMSRLRRRRYSPSSVAYLLDISSSALKSLITEARYLSDRLAYRRTLRVKQTDGRFVSPRVKLCHLLRGARFDLDRLDLDSASRNQSRGFPPWT